MNVKELIAELQKFNPEAIVVYDNMEFYAEVTTLDGKDSDDTEIDLFNEPTVPPAQAKSVVIY